MKECNKRELILVEYNDKGEVIDSRILNHKILLDVTYNGALIYQPLELAYTKYIKNFTDDEFKILTKFINSINLYASYYPRYYEQISEINDENIQVLKSVLAIPNYKLEIFYEIMDENFGRNHLNINDYKLPIDYNDIMSFINNNEGFYYAVNSFGELKYRFKEKPTREQAKQQRLTNGNRIVFKSFRNGQIYNISESELISYENL